MRTFRFFIFPTLLGWLSAFLTCFVLHFGSQWLSESVPSGATLEFTLRAYLVALFFGGIVLVLPSYALIILPLSIADYRSLKRGGLGLSRRIYLGSLLVAGVLATCIFASNGMLDFGWGTRSEWVRAGLFFAPFVVYAWVTSRMAKLLQPERQFSSA